MGKDGNNGFILSSKKAACRYRGEQGREVEKLRAALEAEKSKSRQAQRKLAVELRRLREAAERERLKAERDLTSRHEQEKALELLRLREALQRERHAEVRRILRLKGEELRAAGGGLEKERESARRQARELQRQLARGPVGRSGSCRAAGRRAPGCPGNLVTYQRLERVLQQLRREADGERAALVRRLGEELELEKSYFLRHLLEAHGWAEQEVSGRSRRRSSSCSQLLGRPAKAESDHARGGQRVSRSRSLPHKSRSASPVPEKNDEGDPPCRTSRCSSSAKEVSFCSSASSESRSTQTSPAEGWMSVRQHSVTESAVLDESSLSKCSLSDMDSTNGTDYGYLVRQNSELLRALDELEKTCAALKEENGLLRKSSSPETEEKVKRLKRKNAELAVIAKRLEDRARKLQEANLKVVNAPIPMKAGAVEQYKRAFARQRARDLAQHADTLLSKDKEIAALQQECRELQARLGTGKGSPSPSGVPEFERLLRESQKEVLRLQRQLSVSSCREPSVARSDKDKAAPETPLPAVDEAPARSEEARGEEEEKEEQGAPVSPEPAVCLPNADQSEEQRLQLLESELCKKRKECENLEHEVRKRQKRCLDLESRLEDEQSRNERLEEEADRLRGKAQLLDQVQVENEVLRDDLSDVTAQRNSVLEENQRLRAKLENLEQVLKHMREVAERRQQLELEHEQALAILKFKQDEIKRLQRAQFFAKREHEGVVQMLEELTQLVLQRELSKVRDLEEKCRSQSEQFGLLSQELERFRLQTGKMDAGSSSALPNPGLSHLTNGIGLGGERDLGPVPRPAATAHGPAPGRADRSPGTRHRELPTISAKSGSTSSTPKSDSKHLTPKSESLPHSPRKSSPTHEVDTASEVEELDIDVSPIPYPGSRVAAKLQVFIARYSYNPYDGPNDNPEVELPLTAGEYIYVYGDMDDDGFYEGELMDGRRGLVPSNFVERVSDDDMMSLHPPEAGELSHGSFQDSSLHSEKHLRFSLSSSGRAEPPAPDRAPAPLANGLDLDAEEAGLDSVPYPRKLTLIKQLAKSIIIGWDPPLVPAGWGNVWGYNVFVDEELRLNVPFGAQTKAVLERLDVGLRSYRVSVQSLTDRGGSDRLRCSLLVGRDVSVAPTGLRADCVAATSANLTWLPSNSNYVHVVSLNDEERELVKAGSYSLCLSNLDPNKQYRVKVEARPHRTPWELPLERREHKSATTSFTTLMAGPPDAPLDVQLDLGPTPGIALISWLPVTIDAAGTSNGVRVTGYTIFADKNKVLEVSSPTAGSALLGPSQIHVLKSASELTVRTMSPHGESVDSAPIKVQPRLLAITTGPVPPPHPSPPACSDAAASLDPAPRATPPPTDNASAKPPTPFHSPPLEAHSAPRGSSAGVPKAEPSYAEAWADPSVSVGDVPVITHEVSVASPPRSQLTVSVAMSSGTDEALESHKDPDSPGARRPAASLSEFLEEPVSSTEPSAPLTVSSQPLLTTSSQAPPTASSQAPPATSSQFPPTASSQAPPTVPQATPAAPQDPLNPPDTHPLRPVHPSPLESETEDDSAQSARLVSIEEFLDHGDGGYAKRRQDYAAGPAEPLSEYQAESSRGSDLSDILEEEEEDLYSDPAGEERSRGYGAGGAAVRLDVWEADSDEEVLEKILKLPLHSCLSKQLFSIAEVTEEEDDSLELEEPRPRGGAGHVGRPVASGGSSNGRYYGHADPPTGGRPRPRAGLSGDGAAPARSKRKHRVRYADTVETISYQDDWDSDGGVPSRDVCARGSPERGHGTYPPRGGADRLRREALLRSQMTFDLGMSDQYRHAGPSLKAPAGGGVEIDIEYGTEDDEEGAPYDPGGAAERASSERWAGGGRPEVREEPSASFGLKTAPGPRSRGTGPPEGLPLGPRRASLHAAEVYCAADGRTRETLGSEDPQLAEAAAAATAAWYGQSSPKQGRAEATQPKDGQLEAEPERLVADGEVRIFVALFPYDPAVMSPNPDAAEEELPFKEGQIIKVHGEKDADGFYRGECGGRLGYVPCNMVSEIQVDDEGTRDQLLQQGFLSAEASMEKIGTRSHAQLPRRPVPPTKPRRSKKVESAGVWEDSVDSSRGSSQPVGGPQSLAPRRMVAIFDYDPRESSPNADVEAELKFSAGDVIYVFGDMDDDGFFYGEVNGQKGLVPSNFLQALPEAGAEAAGGPVGDQGTSESRRESQASLTVSEDPPAPSIAAEEESPPAPEPATSTTPPRPPPSESPTQTDASPPGKKKKGFFSKGRKLLKKLGSSKKD
ncbi:peripheral-type benzodiazepine receptor-associated protein 1-like isoform X2 [Anguilla rostrata]|uniref:peripheral-type benzodiazepine receptor-associated protein 1-like isoform X2 n=1 Tax=Anguilla rostrata TaxID=7938 RepID=UPI0030CEB67B